MRELQEDLGRAGTIARLENLLRSLSAAPAGLEDRDYKWLAALLHPFAQDSHNVASLSPSKDIPPSEAGVIISILLEDFSPEDKASHLKRRVAELARLRTALMRTPVDLDEDLVEAVGALLRRLRSHFVGMETPSSPSIDALA